MKLKPSMSIYCFNEDISRNEIEEILFTLANCHKYKDPNRRITVHKIGRKTEFVLEVIANSQGIETAYSGDWLPLFVIIS